MIISDSKRLVFVHVQKTGGVTLTNLLKSQLPDVRSVGKRHAPLKTIIQKDESVIDYWTFGFVRNPWDRMVSWWSMIENWREWSERKDIDIEDRWNPMWRTASTYTSFEQFVHEGPASFTRLRRNQVDYLTSRRKNADFVGRTENLAEDSRHALEQLGLSTEGLGHDNKSKRVGYRDYYTAETRDVVGEVFAKDVAAYNYDF